MATLRFDREKQQYCTPSQHIWVITGPAGCGKSTVGTRVAKEINAPFIEGESIHPPANIKKMSDGIPLTDADRWDWLETLREEALCSLTSGNPYAILSCSALKKK